jgi:hypothetical protein
MFRLALSVENWFDCVLMYQSEADCRSLIDLYLLFAMEISKTIWKPKKRSIIFRERNLSHPNIPGIGAISGPADYLIGHPRSSSYSKNLLAVSPGLANPGDRLFVVVKAKKGDTVTKESSQSQLLAQLLTLELGQS